MRTTRLAAVLVALSLAASCTGKKTLVPFVIPQTPTEIVSGKTVFFYSVFDNSGQAVRTAFEVSTDNGRTFVLATPADGSPPLGIAVADPFGAPNAFYWDSFADLGPGVFPHVVIRATGFANGATGRQAVTLPFAANESGSFTPTIAPSGAARSGAFAGPLPDGAVLLAGGVQGSSATTLVEVYDPSVEQVQPASALPVARTSIAGALLTSGQVLLAGGADVSSSSVANAELFSRATNAITGIPLGLNVPRAGAAVGPLPAGFAVVAGGIGPGGAPVPQVELYDPNAGPQGAFTIVTTDPLAAVSFPTATALPDGRVLFAGGADASGRAVATTFLFDPATRALAPGASMSTARVGHRATRLVSGKVFVGGGRSQLTDPTTATETAEIYDPASNTFTAAALMSHARSFHGQDLAGGRVVAVCGSGPGGDTDQTGEVYDVDANAWTPLPFTPGSPRFDATLVTSGPGRALLAGGGAAPELYHPLDAQTTLQAHSTIGPDPIPIPPGTNPTTVPPPLQPITTPFLSEAWIALRVPTRGRAFHTATRLTTGDVLLVGGTSGVSTATASCELFEVAPLFTASDTIATRASLNVARSHHAAAFLFDGQTLVSGGLGADGTVLGSLERYNFLGDAWTTSTATLAHPRYDHHAVQLENGDILIVGGRDAKGVPVGEAELYHAFSDTLETVGTEITPRSDDDVITLPDGAILVAGGRDATGTAVTALETFDPVNHTFASGGLLLEGRAGVALAPTFDNFQFVALGGEPGKPGAPALADYEAIDVTSFVPVPVAGSPQALDSPRAFHKVSAYLDRALLLEGGENRGLPLDTSSLYIPSTDVFVPPGAYQAFVRPPLNARMNMPRIGFTATPLVDGRILIVGGVDHRGVVVPGLEVFVR